MLRGPAAPQADVSRLPGQDPRRAGHIHHGRDRGGRRPDHPHHDDHRTTAARGRRAQRLGVAWLLWNYTDNNHFYALALKPNGWEVSKQDTAYPGYQRFLSSGNTPVYPPGKSHDVTVTIDTTKTAEVTFTITVDGQELGTVTDKQSPYRSGAVAAYCEDSDVTFTPITEDE